MSDSGKIYFVSDVHLGAPALKNNRERELLFAQWLDFIAADAKELYLMGDIFDFWFEYKKVVPRGFTRVIGRLANMADNGVKIHYFTGNHDVWVFDYLPEEIGLTLHRKELITDIMGKKFFLAHGDGYDENDRAYLFLKRLFSNKRLQWCFARLHPNLAFYLAHRWSKSSRLSKKGSDKKEFKVKNEAIYRYARNYLSSEWIDYFIFGHRHRIADIEVEKQSRLILLGDWITNFSYGVFDGENFALNKFEQQVFI